MYVFKCADGVDVSFGKEIELFSNLAKNIFEEDDIDTDPWTNIQYNSHALIDIKRFMELCKNKVPKPHNITSAPQSVLEHLTNESHFEYISEIATRDPKSLAYLMQVANFMDIQSILDIAFPYIMLRFKLTPESDFNKKIILDDKPSEELLEKFNKLLRFDLSLVL